MLFFFLSVLVVKVCLSIFLHQETQLLSSDRLLIWLRTVIARDITTSFT
jgi:hypothetical protein